MSPAPGGRARSTVPTKVGSRDLGDTEALSRRYQLDMDMDWDSVPELMGRHGLEGM